MNPLLIKIFNQRMVVNAACLAVNAIASGGPEKALKEIDKLREMVEEYAAQVDSDKASDTSS